MKLTKLQRRAVLLAANVSQANIRIEIVPGASAPRYAGHGYYWTTPSGKTIVHHPCAYRWPTLYHPSTRRVVVGADWLAPSVMAVAA